MAEKTAKKPEVPTPRTSPVAEKSTDQKGTVDRTVDLSQDVLKSVEAGQLAAIEAVREFVEAVDEALPTIDVRPSRREVVIDAALELTDKLVTTQYEFLHGVVRDAARSLSKPSGTET